MPATVRAARPWDEADIRSVQLACFPTDAEARLVDALRVNAHLTASLVAEVDGQVVGHIAFSPVSAASGLPGVGLAPVAVVPSHRRCGLAAELIAQGLAMCVELGFGWVVVLGRPEYYSRFGFRPAAEVGLEDEYSGGPAFQARELVSGMLPKGAGLVRYSPEFAAVAPTRRPLG